MKYANRITENELRELYQMFTDTDAKIKELNIKKDDYSILLNGYLEVPEWNEDVLAENPDATVIIDDDYKITDYDVTVYHHSGDCTLDYRKWMFDKFGAEYAKDFLLNTFVD